MTALEGTVDLPGMGRQSKKTVILLAAGGAVVVGVAVWRYRQQQSANASTTPDPGTAETVDPTTGYPYGSADDAAALADQYSYDTGTQNIQPASTPPTAYTSNAQWTQAAVTILGNEGFQPTNVQRALGKYVNGESVEAGSNDQQLIEAAISAVGQPPVPGPSGYPPSIRTVAAPPPVHHKEPQVTTPHLAYEEKTDSLHWTLRANANGYSVRMPNGREDIIQRGNTTSIRVPAGDGRYEVRALGKTGYRDSAWSNAVNVQRKTAKKGHK